MSTLSLRKIKHDSSSVDNITLDSSGNTGFGISTPGARVDVSVPSGINMRLTKSSGSYLEYHDGTVARASISGLSGVDGLSINTGTSHTERVRIDASGRVTMPYQVAFAAWYNGSTYSNSPIFDTVSYNVGNAYNSSTGVFTAPVLGKYMFTGWYRLNQTGATYCQFGLKKNGSSSNFNGAYVNSTFANSTYSTPIIALPIYLSAGDTISCYASVSGGSPSVSGAESWFSGYLLG